MSIQFDIVNQAGLTEEGGHEDNHLVAIAEDTVELLKVLLVHHLYVLHLAAVRQHGLQDDIPEAHHTTFAGLESGLRLLEAF